MPVSSPNTTPSTTATHGSWRRQKRWVQSASPSSDVYYPDIRAITPDGTTAVGPLAAGERPALPLPEGSAFEIALPPHFHRDDYPSFTLQWIDFYR